MSLYFSEMTLPCGDVGPDSCLPALFSMCNVQAEKELYITEEDEVFSDIGRIPCILPYQMQVLNRRALSPCTWETAVLENDFLKAVFLPGLGGRLWSLFDKQAGRPLLYVNDCIRPGNLGLCGAWFSGGVEWNIGMIGHSPLTCRALATARLTGDDGRDILRMYGYERIRKAVFQMDFSLPEDSRVLLCRMRIKNTQKKTIPMYWFSNIALPELSAGRVLVPSEDAYFGSVGAVYKTSTPLNAKGRDVSYPVNTLPSTDYFYKIPERKRKFIAYADGDGVGMFQTSTARQKGRKLFVWGQGNGAARWQQWLTHEAGRYIEVQAGVGPTQYECIPMPPLAAWEWMEAYGPLQIESKDVGGDYQTAVAQTEAAMEELVSEEWLEGFLRSSKEEALRPAVLVSPGEGDGWAALENIRRQKEGLASIEPHLDFGAVTSAQKSWLSLLEKGVFPETDPGIAPEGLMIDPAWEALLTGAPSHWLTWFHQGIFRFAREDWTGAEDAFGQSAACCDNPWAEYGLAVLYTRQSDRRALDCIRRAAAGQLERIEMVREYFRILLHFGAHDEVLRRFEELPNGTACDEHVRFWAIKALLACGRLDEAECMLMADGGLEIPDFREGENELSELWLDLQDAKAKAEGRPFDRAGAVVPLVFDFRMQELDE